MVPGELNLVAYNWCAGLVQSLPKLASVNASLFLVWSGYQDYFFSLYDKALSPSKTKKIVPDVVEAIEELLVVSFTCYLLKSSFKVVSTQL